MEHSLSIPYSKISLVKFVGIMLFTAHWVRVRLSVFTINPLSLAFVPLTLRVSLNGYFMLAYSYLSLHFRLSAQFACIWRIVVDIEGDSHDPDVQNWITGMFAMIPDGQVLLAL